MIMFFSVQRGWGYDAIQPEVTEEAHGWGICRMGPPSDVNVIHYYSYNYSLVGL